MEIAPGTTIHQKYKIEEKIGEGSNGLVYRAIDTDLGKLVALKFLREEFAFLPSYRKHFLKEAKLAARFIHKSSVPIRSVGEWKNTLYLAMDFHSGKTLKQILLERALSLPEIREIGVQLIECLADAHQQGMVHRDIKPANLMIKEEGGKWSLTVLDFGLASSYEEGLEKISGTPAYMSPEQLLGGSVGIQSDLYSSALCLYEMVTHRLPHSSPEEDVIGAVLQKEIPRPSQFRNVPRALDAFFKKALAFDPQHRYPNAVEFKAALVAAIESPTRLYFKTGVSLLLVVAVLSLCIWGAFRYRNRQDVRLLEKEGQAFLSRQEWDKAIETGKKMLLLEGQWAGDLLQRGIWQKFCDLQERGQEQETLVLLDDPILKRPELEVFREWMSFFHIQRRMYKARFMEAIACVSLFDGHAPLKKELKGQADRCRVLSCLEHLQELMKSSRFVEAEEYLLQIGPLLPAPLLEKGKRRLQEHRQGEDYLKAIKENDYPRAIRIAGHFPEDIAWQKRKEYADGLLNQEIGKIRIVAPSKGEILNSRVVKVAGEGPISYLPFLKVNGAPVTVESQGWSTRVVLSEGKGEIVLTYETSSYKTTLARFEVLVDVTAPKISVQSAASDLRTGVVVVRGNASDENGIEKVECEIAPVEAISDGYREWSCRVPMKKIEGALAFIARDRAKNPGKITIDIRKETDPPTVFVELPSADAIVYGRTLRIKGTVRDLSGVASLKVNGIPVNMSSSREEFQAEVEIERGKIEGGRYPVLFEAEDHWGNRREASLYVRPQYYLWNELRCVSETDIFHNKIWGLCYSPCSRYLVCASNDGQIRVLNASSWQVRETLNGPFVTSQDIAITPAIRFVSEILEKTSDRQKKEYFQQTQVAGIWTLSRESLGNYGMDFVNGYLGPQARYVALTHDYQKIAVGHKGGYVHLFHRDPSAFFRFRAHKGEVASLIFSPDGKLLASGGGDRVVRIWDAQGNLVNSLSAHTMTITALAFYKDGEMLASGSHDKTVCLWSVADGSLICRKQGHTASIISLTFSPEGESLVTASASGKLLVWKK